MGRRQYHSVLGAVPGTLEELGEQGDVLFRCWVWVGGDGPPPHPRDADGLRELKVVVGCVGKGPPVCRP